MKKAVLFFATIFTMASCTKEQLGKKCNCGVVQSDNVSNYSVVIKNDCSGNFRTFYLTEADWMGAYVGSNYCITNITNW